jgi:hypothetical protein
MRLPNTSPSTKAFSQNSVETSRVDQQSFSTLPFMSMTFYESLIFGIRQNEVKAKGVQNSDQMKVKNAVELSPMLSSGQRFERLQVQILAAIPF